MLPGAGGQLGRPVRKTDFSAAIFCRVDGLGFKWETNVGLITSFLLYLLIPWVGHPLPRPPVIVGLKALHDTHTVKFMPTTCDYIMHD